MLYYDWKRLYKSGKGVPWKIVSVFKDLANRKRTLYTDIVYRGICDHYILEEKILAANEINATDNEICVALHISSMRNYLIYKLTGEKGVYIQLAAEYYDVDKLRLNRLLTIENNMIYLKQEKTINGY